MQLLKDIPCNQWNYKFPENIINDSIESLEMGQVLHCPNLPFILLPQELNLLNANLADTKSKNISFDSIKNTLRGAICSEETGLSLKKMMQRFSQHSQQLLSSLLPRYIDEIKLGRTSFRPVEISGRVSSYRKDDTRLHVDAFPATPNQGKRILRIFSNINPNNQSRVWCLGEHFNDVVNNFIHKVSRYSSTKSMLLKTLKMTKTLRTEYDHIMLSIHDQMKADMHYQASVKKQTIHFMSGSTWIVQTDHVSHAALSGQHVLEQTFYLPVHAMKNPEHSPLRVLENHFGKKLI